MMIWVNFPEILVYLRLLSNSSSIRLAKVKIVIEAVFEEPSANLSFTAWPLAKVNIVIEVVFDDSHCLKLGHWPRSTLLLKLFLTPSLLQIFRNVFTLFKAV